MKPGEMLALEQALLCLDEALNDARLPDESIKTLAANNRVRAVSTTSALELPPFDQSAMDGYALPEGQQPVFGLSGNPVAAFLMFHLLVLRAVARLTGGESLLHGLDTH